MQVEGKSKFSLAFSQKQEFEYITLLAADDALSKRST